MTSDTAHDQRIITQFTRWAAPFAALPVHAEADGMARTLSAVDAQPGDRVLDVACGPGIVACALAAQGARVTGIDLTPAMIAEAKARQSAEGLAGLDWQVGDATALPFADETFDRVVTRYSFHHLPEPVAALREMRRVCRAGGRVVVIDATPAADTQVAYDRMETLRDPSHTSALTLEQLRGIGRETGLVEAVIDHYALEAQLATLADARDMAALEAMFDEDISGGQDRIGVGAWRAGDGIRFRFPVSIIAWRRE
ncbi:class I SAM-dependent methyltransferase [Flavisphingomonas formosensis]|uniref:class I SAM-dependent methyltransferase n=1 Tax=Flavisphingomonas formosensis TaxID=861534 RepID=UPI0012F9F7D4|nr:methyltransferase domain-containing protein [Sphingomonas formosensis]